MDINQIIQNLTAKSTESTSGKENQLDATLAEMLKNDPQSFEQVMKVVSKTEEQELNNEELPLKEANKEFTKSLKAEDGLEDNIQMKQSGLKVFSPKDQTKTGGVTVLQEIEIEKTSFPQNNEKVQKILERKLDLPLRDSMESSLSIDEIEDIKTLMNKQSKLSNTQEKEPLLAKSKMEFSSELKEDKEEVDFIKLKNLQKTAGDKLKVNPKKIANQFIEPNEKVIKLNQNMAKPKLDVSGVDSLSEHTSNQSTTNLEALHSSVVPGRPIASPSVDSNPVMNIESLETVDREVLISKISDYIVQNNVKNSPKVEMSFAHQDLGQVELMVEKMAGGNINVTIAPTSTEGMKFFTQHQATLTQTLLTSGVNLGELKLEGQSFSNQQGFDQNSSGGEFAQKFSGQQEQRDHDSRRRQELWQYYQNREAA